MRMRLRVAACHDLRRRPPRRWARAAGALVLALTAGCDWTTIGLEYDVLITPFPPPGATFEVLTFTDSGPLTVPAGSFTFEGTLTPAGGRAVAPGKLRFDLSIDGDKVLSATVRVKGNGELRRTRVKLKKPLDVGDGRTAEITVVEAQGNPIQGSETLSLSATYEAE